MSVTGELGEQDRSQLSWSLSESYAGPKEQTLGGQDSRGVKDTTGRFTPSTNLPGSEGQSWKRLPFMNTGLSWSDHIREVFGTPCGIKRSLQVLEHSTGHFARETAFLFGDTQRRISRGIPVRSGPRG